MISRWRLVREKEQIGCGIEGGKERIEADRMNEKEMARRFQA